MGASTCGAKPLFANVENQRGPTFVDAVGGEMKNSIAKPLIIFPSQQIIALQSHIGHDCPAKNHQMHWQVNHSNVREEKNTSQGIFWGKDVLAAAAIRHVQRASVSVVKINCQEKRALQYGVHGMPIVW